MYGALIPALLADLRMHYAARIAALVLERRLDMAAALAALERERDEALRRLAERLELEKQQAMRAARNAKGRRFRIAPPLLRPAPAVHRPRRLAQPRP